VYRRAPAGHIQPPTRPYIATVPYGIRANDGHRTNILRKQHAASRACQPKRSRNFGRRGLSACGGEL
ncbi:MAG: hypothetical protein ABSH32_31065, partial [Bryobacteraceae bacterium]